MHDLDDAGRGQGTRQRREIIQRQGIDTARVAGSGHLHQAKLGTIGALPQEFGVESDALETLEARAKLGKSGGCCDYGLQRFSV
jgi:hypothetical protein